MWSVSVCNTFVKVDGEQAHDHESDGPCMAHAKTDPAARQQAAGQATTPLTATGLSCLQEVTSERPSTRSPPSSGTSSDGGDGLDEVPSVQPMASRLLTRDPFDSPATFGSLPIGLLPSAVGAPEQQQPSKDEVVNNDDDVNVERQPAVVRFCTRDSFESDAATVQPRAQRMITRDSVESGAIASQPSLQRVVTYDSFESPKGIPTLLGKVDGSAKCFGVPAKCTVMQPALLGLGALMQGQGHESQLTAGKAPLVSQAAESAGCHPSAGSAVPATGGCTLQRKEAAKAVPSAAVASKRGGVTEELSRTTIMLRNLPNNYTREGILELLDAQGFFGRYDFVYLPIDFRTHAALGYCFVNLRTHSDAEALMHTMEGFSRWTLPSSKQCHVSWSHPHQGLGPHIDRYRNSPLMHESVPDTYRPVLFEGGLRVQFPLPTKRIKPPRQGTQRMLV